MGFPGTLQLSFLQFDSGTAPAIREDSFVRNNNTIKIKLLESQLACMCPVTCFVLLYSFGCNYGHVPGIY